MENKINIAELLKDCPKGMELDCTIWDNVVLAHVDINSKYPIWIKKMEGEIEFLTENGCFNFDCSAKCVIFPKGETTWEGFVPPCEFKDGDIVATTNGLWIGITTGGKSGESIPTYCVTTGTGVFEAYFNYREKWKFQRLATEEEKQKLFDAIKSHGYEWNAYTKTLEKLVEPIFEVGNKVRNKNNHNVVFTISSIEEDFYVCGGKMAFCFNDQDDWELVPNKFDINTLIPFESKVLVRHNKDNTWCGSFFSHIDGNFHSHCYKYVTIAGKSYPMCIPYEKNEHLLGTTNDCEEYFKNW